MWGQREGQGHQSTIPGTGSAWARLPPPSGPGRGEAGWRKVLWGRGAPGGGWLGGSGANWFGFSGERSYWGKAGWDEVTGGGGATGLGSLGRGTTGEGWVGLGGVWRR